MRHAVAVKIIKMLKVNYPASFRHMSREDMEIMVALWEKSFRDDEEALIEETVLDYIQNSEEQFAPNIGQIRGHIRRAGKALELTADDAWDLVREGLRKGDPFNEFEKLPRNVQLAVGNAHYYEELGLTEYNQMPFRKSNFLARYNELMDRQEVLDSMNPKLVAAIAEREGRHLPIAIRKLLAE